MNETKCYVGTYKKYNDGDLTGAWLSLSDYESYSEFLAACKKLHADEADPEYMIQDWENLPDGFPAVEWISKQEFDDLKQAMSEEAAEEEKTAVQIVDYSEKAIAVIGETKSIKNDLMRLGGRFNPRLTCGAGWIFSKKSLPQLQHFLNSGITTHTTSENNKTLWEEYKKMDEYWKDTADLFKSENGIIITFPKQSINTSFCWADEGAPYEEYKEVTKTDESLKAHFMKSNLFDLEELIKKWENRKKDYYDNCTACFVVYNNRKFTKNAMLLTPYEKQEEGVFQFGRINKFSDSNGTLCKMTDSDYNNYIEMAKRVRDAFEKRLQQYLNRYGTSKLKIWTYWADR